MNILKGTINIRRIAGTPEHFLQDTPIQVFLDEEPLGSLNVNETRSYRVPAGDHSLQVKYLLLVTSEIVSFKLQPFETLEFECGDKRGTFQLFIRKVPDRERENASSLAPADSGKSVSNNHIFISYRRSDSAETSGRIYDRLVAKFGRPAVFKDVDSIPLGVNFKEYLDAKVRECKILLAIIGNGWLKASDAEGKVRLQDPADYVRIEIESALERKIRVIPLLVGGASMPSEKDLPPSLRELVNRNGTEIRLDPDFHRDMDRLISFLEKYISPPKK